MTERMSFDDWYKELVEEIEARGMTHMMAEKESYREAYDSNACPSDVWEGYLDQIEHDKRVDAVGLEKSVKATAIALIQDQVEKELLPTLKHIVARAVQDVMKEVEKEIRIIFEPDGNEMKAKLILKRII